METTSGLGRRMTVGVPAAKIDDAVENKLAETAKRARIDGFRPGKVPLREVRRRFGKAIREEVIGEIVSNSFYEAMNQQALNPAGYPSIERTKDQPGEDFEFVATFEVYPQVSVQGLSNITVTRPIADISDADIDTMIQRLREQRATYADVDRAAQNGDQLIIDFAGTKDGVPFQGGSAENSKLVLGSGSMIPGFEDGLVGATKGEERVLALTFPADYHSEELKGQAVQFAVTVKAVQEKQLPEVNEEFIKQFSPKDSSMENFRVEIRQNMERELKNAVKNRVKKQVMDGVLAQN
ncbi:MAG TPA: trigger factor, partial [Dongiaceae bacterium]|nr:trigger factor [Dongiaceae bacterium]